MTLPWYKRYPKDALDGMAALSLEQRGAYNTILDLIYYRMPNPLPDDDAWLAGQMGLRMPRWRRLKAELIDLGKITCEGGFIVNGRASREISKVSRRPLKDGKSAPVSQPDAAELRAYCSNNTGITPDLKPENYAHNGPLENNKNNDISQPTRGRARASEASEGSEQEEEFLLSSSTQPYFEKPLIRERGRAAEEPAAPLPAEEGFQKMGKGKATLPETVPDEWMLAAQLERGVRRLGPLYDIQTVAAKFLHHMRAEGRSYRDWRARWMKWALDERPDTFRGGQRPFVTGAETETIIERLNREREEREQEQEREQARRANRFSNRSGGNSILAQVARAAVTEVRKEEAPAQAEAEARKAEQLKRDQQAEKQRREVEERRALQNVVQLRIQRIQGHVFARYGLEKGLDVLAHLEAGDPEAELIAQQVEADLGTTAPIEPGSGGP